MSRALHRPTDPFASFPDPIADFQASQDDRDLSALERLFDRLNDEARSLRADARLLGDRVERLGRVASGWHAD
jgi:hypothetical protein